MVVAGATKCAALRAWVRRARSVEQAKAGGENAQNADARGALTSHVT
jgi:hypothetical protein